MGTNGPRRKRIGPPSFLRVDCFRLDSDVRRLKLNDSVHRHKSFEAETWERLSYVPNRLLNDFEPDNAVGLGKI